MATQTYWMKHRRKTMKAFRKHIAVFVSAMKRYPERIDEQQFVSEAEKRFEELLPSIPVQPGSKGHLFNELMPALGAISAAFKVLREHGYSVEQIGRLEYEGYLEMFNDMPAPARWVMRRFMVSSWFPRFMRSACEAMSASQRQDAFDIEYSFQKQDHTTRMRCRRCAMITFMERNGLEEMKPLCNVFDFAQAASVGLGLKQPSCIGAGDATCQYVFSRDEHDTVPPDNVAAVMNAPMAGTRKRAQDRSQAALVD